jgi:hypothetical protein
MRLTFTAILIIAAVALLAGLVASAARSQGQVELVVVGDAHLVMAPNGTAVFDLTVLVTGAGPSAWVQIALEGLPTGWAGDIDVDASETTVYPNGTGNVTASLDVGHPANITLTVIAGKAPLAGDYQLQLTASILDTDSTDRAALAVTVLPTYRLSLLFDAPATSALPGDVVEFIGQARNRGNGPDHVVIECTGAPAGWPVTVVPSDVRLGARATAILVVRVEVPRELDGTPARDHRFNIRATGAGGATWATAVMNVTIRDYSRVEWTIEGSPLTGLDSREAQLPNVSLNPFSPAPAWAPAGLGLLSRGNVVANVTVEASSSTPWLQVEVPIQGATISPQGVAKVGLRILASRDAQAGSYVVTLNATCDGGSGTLRTLRVPIEILNLDVLVVHLVNATGDTVNDTCCNGTSAVVRGNEVTLKCFVYNIGSVGTNDGVLHLRYRAPTGGPMVELRAFPVDLARGANTNFTYSWAPRDVGSHYFEFTLELANQSVTFNDNASMVVSVREPVAEVGPGPAPAVAEASATAYAMAALVVAAVALITHRWRRILRDEKGT